MSAQRIIRKTHRWISILFTAAVVVAFIVPVFSPTSEWVYFLPLGPLFILLLSGLYLFALPLLGKRQKL